MELATHQSAILAISDQCKPVLDTFLRNHQPSSGVTNNAAAIADYHDNIANGVFLDFAMGAGTAMGATAIHHYGLAHARTFVEFNGHMNPLPAAQNYKRRFAMVVAKNTKAGEARSPHTNGQTAFDDLEGAVKEQQITEMLDDFYDRSPYLEAPEVTGVFGTLIGTPRRDWRQHRADLVELKRNSDDEHGWPPYGRQL